MLTRFGLAILNGIITYIVLIVFAAILDMVTLGQIGAIISRFALLISFLVALLTFLGSIPSYWRRPV